MPLFGEGCQSAGRSVHGGVTDRQHGDHDDNIHDTVETADTCVVDGDDEGRGFGVRRSGAVQQTRFRVWNEESDDGQGDDVEERDTPEHLLDGGRQGLARIGRLRSSEPDQFGPGERKSCSDKDGAKTFETVVERAWISPVTTADVAASWSTTAVENDSQDANHRFSNESFRADWLENALT